MAVFHTAEKWREAIRGYEGEFLTTLIGNPAIYMISNSEEADMLVDLMAKHMPVEFIRRVGQFAFDEVEVA